jgi:hypothetical protein
MVPRLGGAFVHHGIDCGDGTVIHYTGDTWMAPRRVRRTSMQDFSRGAAVAVRNYDEFFARLQGPEQLPRRMNIRWRRELMRFAGREWQGGAFEPDAVIARAESRLGSPAFDVVLNNCEHFATWCKTGISDSEQVYALWRSIMDPMSYLRLRRSSADTAMFQGPAGSGRGASGRARGRRRDR